MSFLRSGIGHSILLAALLAQGSFGGVYFMAEPCRSGREDERHQHNRQEFMKW